MRIKICGITNVADALQAIDAGADALGFNFYPQSPRCVSLETMRELQASHELRAQLADITVAGVFVNSTNPELLKIAELGALDAVQLHGDETPQQTGELVSTLKMASALPAARSQPFQVWRAFRCREANLSDVAGYLKECRSNWYLPNAALLDAYAPEAFGGTGKVVDWHAVRQNRDQLHGVPVILAGGLNPDNVAEAIRTARPDAVDVASGVESSPGKKDPAKVRDFIAAAQAAFHEVAAS